MLVDFEVKYQGRYRLDDGTIVDDGRASSTDIGQLYVPNNEVAARVGNALAQEFWKQNKERYPGSLTSVSILIFGDDKLLIEAWPAATKYYVERD